MCVRVSKFLNRNGFGVKKKGNWDHGPTLDDFCNGLEQRNNIVSTLDDSVGYLIPTENKEVMFELRDANDFLKDYHSKRNPFTSYGIENIEVNQRHAPVLFSMGERRTGIVS